MFRRFFRRRALVVVSFCAALFVVAELADDDGVRQFVRLRQSIEETEVDNAKLRGDVERLRRRVAALKEEPRALERAAREHGYVREDELLFVLE